MTALLRVEVARKGFADREVLAGIRFELARGEIVAITGPSGCGKSTLLRLVAGLDGDFAGAVTWRGAPPRLAMAFQEPRLLPWRSVRDNLLLADTPAASAEAMLAAMDLLTEADVTADRLSLLRALGSGPELLLLDEPFVSLDAAAAARARALLLRAWAEHGFAVLLVTHDQTEAAALADRILCLAGRPARLDREIMVPEMLRRPA
jgi:ABC-type nitrate/sulfonate/bicarbonate transport system ATPase subunit